MAKRHWAHNDFVSTATHLPKPEELDAAGVGYGIQQGYCKKCTADMQRFFERYNTDGSVLWGPIRHYNSHGNYKHRQFHA